MKAAVDAAITGELMRSCCRRRSRTRENRASRSTATGSWQFNADCSLDAAIDTAEKSLADGEKRIAAAAGDHPTVAARLDGLETPSETLAYRH